MTNIIKYIIAAILFIPMTILGGFFILSDTKRKPLEYWRKHPIVKITLWCHLLILCGNDKTKQRL